MYQKEQYSIIRKLLFIACSQRLKKQKCNVGVTLKDGHGPCDEKQQHSIFMCTRREKNNVYRGVSRSKRPFFRGDLCSEPDTTLQEFTLSPLNVFKK